MTPTEIDIRRGQPGDAPGIAETVVETLYAALSQLDRDKDKLVRALAAMLHPDKFVVAAIRPTQEVVGVAAIADAGGYAATVSDAVLRKEFGLFKSKLASSIMKDEIYRPESFRPGEGHVYYMGIKEGYRAGGIAEALISALQADSRYQLLTLEVIEGDEQVLPLYEKMGFVQVGRAKEPGAALKGFHFRYQLEWTKTG